MQDPDRRVIGGWLWCTAFFEEENVKRAHAVSAKCARVYLFIGRGIKFEVYCDKPDCFIEFGCRLWAVIWDDIILSFEFLEREGILRSSGDFLFGSDLCLISCEI